MSKTAPRVMTIPQMKALLESMQDTAETAGQLGDFKLKFQIQCKIAELAIQLDPKLRAIAKPVRAAAPGRKGRPEPEPEVPTAPEEDSTALAALSDEELERSLGR